MRPPQITDLHLSRRALYYLRQSSNEQVRFNVGSTAVQRDLEATLQAWGWPLERIEAVEQDLGVSGSVPGLREGFRYLLAQMRTGTVGLVAVTDSSRLTRNLRDLAEFDEVARQYDVLLAVGGQVTDFRDPNGAFIGTILGANAARENRTRVDMSTQARRKKAEAGIAVTHPPIGYLSAPGGHWVKDSDPRVRDAIQLIFDKFVELPSTGAVVRFLRRRAILVPMRTRRNSPLKWVDARRTEIYRILRHPAYAGIYVYGRTKRLEPVAGRVRRRLVRREEGWPVQINDHHEPYIQPVEWDRVQEQLTSNNYTLRRPAGRGEALVQGVLRCTRHNLAFRTMYTCRDRRPDAPTKRAADYLCLETSITGESTVCGRLRAHRIDKLVEDEVLRTLVPPSLDAIEEVAREAMREYHMQQRAREGDLRRAEQVADEAERKLDQTDANQIRVRERLSTRLEDALQRLEALRVSHQARPLHPPLTLDEDELAELRSLLEELPTLWRHPSVTPEQRKALVRRVIKAVYATPGLETWTLDIEWVGGARTNLELLTVQGVEAELRRIETTGLKVSEILEHLKQRGIMQMSGRAAGKPYTKQRLQCRRRLARRRSREDTPSGKMTEERS